MAKDTEATPQHMILQSGSTTLTLDKTANTATMRRKFLFWNLKPMVAPLADLVNVEVDAGMDRASGIEVCNTMLITRAGAAWALPASDKRDAETTATAMKQYLGLA